MTARVIAIASSRSITIGLPGSIGPMEPEHHYLLLYEYVEDILEKREPYRDACARVPDCKAMRLAASLVT